MVNQYTITQIDNTTIQQEDIKRKETNMEDIKRCQKVE